MILENISKELFSVFRYFELVPILNTHTSCLACSISTYPVSLNRKSKMSSKSIFGSTIIWISAILVIKSLLDCWSLQLAKRICSNCSKLVREKAELKN